MGFHVDDRIERVFDCPGALDVSGRGGAGRRNVVRTSSGGPQRIPTVFRPSATVFPTSTTPQASTSRHVSRVAAVRMTA
jgi:hypothetical protein